MERQLVKHGKFTLMVSLPKKWLDKQDLAKGDSVHITTSADKIIINPKERNEKILRETIYLPKSDYNEIHSKLGVLYRKGYKEVLLKYDNPSCFYHIQSIVKLLHGFEIIEQTENSCLIKNIMKEIDFDIDKALNKVVNIIKAEFSIVREYLIKGEKGKNHELRTLRDECWKLKNLIYLCLRENLFYSSDNYFLIHIIEQNASFLYWIYRSFDRSDLNKVSPEFLKLYDEIGDYFSQSITKMKKKDKNYIEYIMTNREKLLKECEEYTLKKTKDRFLAIYLSMLVQNIHNPKSLIV